MPSKSYNKQAIAKAFSRAAGHYDHFAGFQRCVGDQLLAHCDWSQHGILLDAGAGSGWYSRKFRQSGHRVIALDLANGMLQQAKQQQSADFYLQADLENLPLTTHSLDYLWSNLALQWCGDFAATLQQFQRCIKPSGKLAFSTLAAGSLPELDAIWQGKGLTAPINRWPDAETLINQAQQLGLRAWHAPVVCHYPTAMAALWSLKGIGASHLHSGRTAGLGGKQFFADVAAMWPQDEQGFRLTYQIVFGISQ